MLEVHVDVGRFAAGGGYKTLKQHVDPFGVHARYPNAVADGAVGRRSPSLAENAPRAGEAHKIVNGEKIGLYFHLADKPQFTLDQGADFFRNAPRVARRRPVPCQLAKV